MAFIHIIALGIALSVSCCAPAAAQETVTIVGRGTSSAALAGFGDTPLARAPLQATVTSAGQLADQGISQFSGLTRLDASVGDAYNAEGYWSNLSMRGFTLDNRFNYRRDGLPINAETALALENKDRLEVLKGTSGIQAGTSSPGGLLNLVVKRPNGDLRSVRLEVREAGSRLAALDIGQRFGGDSAIAVRLNAAAEHLDPQVRRTKGHRSLLSIAADWQLSADSLLQAEVESSRQSQPSVVGYSMLGNSIPSPRAVDPRLNLNDQSWRQNVVLDGDTASMRWQQRLGDQWSISAHVMQQSLRSDDRTAFPYGVYDAASYNCPTWCDRFAPDGSFTYWQYISDNERRTSKAGQLAVTGRWRTGAVVHAIETGVLATRYRGRFQDQVFDIAGTGRVDSIVQNPASAGFTDANTDRDERGTELFLRDAVQLGPDWQMWLGLRQTRLQRQSIRTSADSDGSLRATDYGRSATTPWLALAWQLGARTMLYGSWGRGLETDVTPNRARYVNAGESIALQSRQYELGIKHGSDRVEASLTLFDIERGQTADIGLCGATRTCERVLDGDARHRGIEGSWSHQGPAWTWQASATLLDAQRRASRQPGVNGIRPVNVPAASLRLSAEYRPGTLPGLAWQAGLSGEGDRVVLPNDESVRIPGWSRLDLGARWRQELSGTTLLWRVGLDNAANRRAWKESPYQFGHVYLYPLAPRTLRASLQATF
jgi:iron complex outermembrane receptor protein